MLAAASASAQPTPPKRIAITVGDLPFAATTPISTEEAAALNPALLAALRRDGRRR